MKKQKTDVAAEVKPTDSKSKKTYAVIAVIIALFVAATVLAAVFSYKVTINYNITDYLDDSTQTKIALNIIEDEFGMTGSIQVMAKNVDEATAEDIRDTIKKIDNVLSVRFDKYDADYYKDNTALFNIVVDGDDYSDNAKQVTADLRRELKKYEIELGGTAIEKQSLQNSITGEIVYILIIALCLVVAILLITSKSWLEPLVLLAAAGVAIVINKGTNVFFGSISYITNSIAAILQLALSIDYSIVLLHAYRKCKEEKSAEDTNADVMKKAIVSVIKPVSASSLTTIAGLLALLFMTFTIGFDIGIVLMKGIVISVITSLTLLPALVLLLDKALVKTRKKAFVPKGKFFCNTSFKAGKIIAPIALAVIIVCGVIQPLFGKYTFTDARAGNAEIKEKFGQNNSVAVVYKNTENNYDNEQLLVEKLYGYKKADGTPALKNYTAYTNTAREEYDAEKAQQKLDLSENDSKMLLTMVNLYGAPDSLQLTLAQFVNYAALLLATDADTQQFADADTAKTLLTLKLIGDVMDRDNTAEEFCAKLNQGFDDVSLDLDLVQQMYAFYFAQYGASPTNTIKGRFFVAFVIAAYQSNPLVQQKLSPKDKLRLDDMLTVDVFLSDSTQYSFAALRARLQALQAAITSDISSSTPEEDKIAGVYIKYSVNHDNALVTPVMAFELLDFVSGNMDTNTLLKRKMSDDKRKKVDDGKQDLQKAEDLFIGEKYSRLLLSVDLPSESAETTKFVKFLNAAVKEVFGENNAYVAGEIISTNDLKETFSHDNLLITIFTIVAIFLIVAAIFRSLSLPVILVAIIQGAIWISMTFQLIGNGMFFMSYIVATCILMGATIDYGILMSSNYVANRQLLDKKEALYKSVETAMPTVFSSGLILTVCGFVVCFISSQNAISTVGLLLGVGTLCSVLMITFVLPSVLYLLDKFVLKLSWKKKNKKSE